MLSGFILEDHLQEVIQNVSFPNIEGINYCEFCVLSTMILGVIWFLCISISAVTSSADAFRGVLPLKKFHPDTLKDLMTRGDSIRTSFRDSFSSTTDFLNDLEPPFALHNGTDGEEEALDTIMREPDVTHFLFLLHGHRGQSKDLGYMKAMMQKLAFVEKKRSNDASLTTVNETRTQQILRQEMVVHSAICNEHKTKDGIRNGGDRLVTEMLEVIETEMNKRHPGSSSDDEIYDITISILGNSLGGLYGRYAIAKFVERHCVKESDEEGACWIVGGKYRLFLNVFCTTATPHLGVSKHTYFSIPRTAEIAAAHALRDTGKDLFRLNDLLHTMATCPTYLEPLANFRKRIAYANAFGTDFPVPTATAAFLSENSTYPHHFVDESMDVVPEQQQQQKQRRIGKRKSTKQSKNDVEPLQKKLFIAALHTPRAHNETLVVPSKSETNVEGTVETNSSISNTAGETEHKDEFHEMSESLDKLGWKKVFIDIRSELPTMEIPKTFRKRRLWREKDPKSVETKCIHTLKKRRTSLPSKDLASAVGAPTDNRVSWPLGHNMIVAFSRSRMSTFMNKGGRPVVDAVAKELVEDIFAWDFPPLSDKQSIDDEY